MTGVLTCQRRDQLYGKQKLTFALGSERSCRNPVAYTLTFSGRERPVVLYSHAPDHAVALDALGNVMLVLGELIGLWVVVRVSRVHR